MYIMYTIYMYNTLRFGKSLPASVGVVVDAAARGLTDRRFCKADGG